MCAALPARTRIVQSSTNRWVKALRAAVAHPPAAGAGSESLLALEGMHLLLEALCSGLRLHALFFRMGEEHAAWPPLVAQGSPAALAETELLLLPPSLFDTISGTDAPQGVAALAALPEHTVDGALHVPDPLVLVLAGLGDPGNVGTLLRSAEALGAHAALLLGGTASPWNGKALRASAGSALRLPWSPVRDAQAAAALLQTHGICSYAAVPRGGTPASATALHGPCALWVGSEGAGLSADALACCDQQITLPMPGPVESLNAAVAGSLLLYQALLQRSGSSKATLAGRGLEEEAHQ